MPVECPRYHAENREDFKFCSNCAAPRPSRLERAFEARDPNLPYLRSPIKIGDSHLFP
jgi:hypothetical protein